MVQINGNDIALTRGDTLTLGLRFGGRVAPPTARALFTVKKNPRDRQAVIEKTLPIRDSAAVLTLAPEDTRALSVRTYFWDVRLLYAEGQVYTPMEYAAFQVLEVIGNG